jgi:hypothetical protein
MEEALAQPPVTVHQVRWVMLTLRQAEELLCQFVRRLVLASL